MVRCFFLVFALTLPLFVIAQQREVLDWNFFKNDRPANGEWQAFTWYNLNYRYRVLGFDGGGVKLTFDVISKMDTTKSYFERARREKNDVYLLKHEQGHADIAFIYAIQLSEIYRQTSFSRANYRTEVKQIFDRVFTDMRAEQARYDEEVDHGKNRKEQARWDVNFATKIAEIEKARKP